MSEAESHRLFIEREHVHRGRLEQPHNKYCDDILQKYPKDIQKYVERPEVL